MEVATIQRSPVLINLQGSLDVGASAGLPVTGENFRRWRECTTASVASIQRLTPAELIITLQAAHAMADHGAIFRHCTALRGECHRAMGVGLPDCLRSSSEACDRPFPAAADGSRRLPPPAGAPDALPVRSEDEDGYTAATVAEVLRALPQDLAKAFLQYAFVPALHMAPQGAAGRPFCPAFADADGRDARAAALWFPPQFTAFPTELHPLVIRAFAPCIEAEQALTVDLGSAERGPLHDVACIARALPHLPTITWVKLSTGCASAGPGSPSGSESEDIPRNPHACACAELVEAVCTLPEISSICLENPEQRMPRYGSGMLAGSGELDPQALELLVMLTRNLPEASSLTSLTLRNIPLRHASGGAFIEAAARLPRLERFHLDNCDVDAQCMRKLNSHLRKFASLEDFHLATVGGAHAADPAPALVSVCSRPSMRSVSLRAPVTVQSALQIVKSVARQTTLQRLQLDLHHACDTKTPYFSNNALLGLCDMMADHLPHSMHLTHLAVGGVITASCASSLGELLCRLPRLRRLEVAGLKLKDGHSRSWPVEASQVAYGLAQARSLSHLSVAFHVMSPPDPAALVTLGDELRRKCRSISALRSLAIHNGIDQQLKRLYHVDSLGPPASGAMLMHEPTAPAGRAEYPWLAALAACMHVPGTQVDDNRSGAMDDWVPFEEVLVRHESGGFDSSEGGGSGLRELDLGNNCLGVLSSDLIGVAARLCAEIGPRMPPMHALTRLDLRGNDIDGPGMAVLAPALQQLSELRVLDLSRNEFGDDGAAALARAVRAEPACEGLATAAAAGANVYVVPEVWCKGMADMRGGPRDVPGLALLEELRVNDCEIEQRGCEDLVRALRMLEQLKAVGVRGVLETCVAPLLTALWEAFPTLEIDV